VGNARVVAIEMVGRLGRPVRPQQSEDLALFQLQVDAIERGHHAQLRQVNLGQIFQFRQSISSPGAGGRFLIVNKIIAPGHRPEVRRRAWRDGKKMPLALVCATQGHTYLRCKKSAGGPGLAGEMRGWLGRLERLSIPYVVNSLDI